MKSKKLTEGILIFYVVMLVWIILFKMDVSVENFGQMRSINLVPFSQSVIVNDKLDVSEIIQNVLAFVPLGILIYTIWQEKSWRFKLGVIVVTSVMLEVLQYILGIGASDITDVISNSLGGIIGVIISVVLSKISSKNWIKIINILSLIGAVLSSLFFAILIFANL